MPNVKLEDRELEKFTDLCKAKTLLKNKIDECIEEISRIEIVLLFHQQDIEQRYGVKLDNKSHVLNLKTGEIEEKNESKIITP